jgi:hypothetical protein
MKNIPIDVIREILSYSSTCHFCNRYCIKYMHNYCDRKCYFISKYKKLITCTIICAINVIVFNVFDSFVNFYKILSLLFLIISFDDLF